MKTYTVQNLIIVFVTAFAVGMAVAHLSRPRVSVPPAAIAPVVTHVHQWSKWSEPTTVSNWFVGTRFTQTRACTTCGEAEMRAVQVSPDTVLSK